MSSDHERYHAARFEAGLKINFIAYLPYFSPDDPNMTPCKISSFENIAMFSSINEAKRHARLCECEMLVSVTVEVQRFEKL